jgi:hypothetical protein
VNDHPTRGTGEQVRDARRRDVTMIVRLTYNCEPDSLGEIDQGAFVEALENEMMVDPRFRECTLYVTFETARSGVTSIAVTDDDSADPDDYQERLTHFADHAFDHCCNEAAQ